jgi:hypothetical protein
MATRHIEVSDDGERVRASSGNGPWVELVGRLVITTDNRIVWVGDDEREALRDLMANAGSRMVKPFHPIEGEPHAAAALLRYAVTKADKLASIGLVEAWFRSTTEVNIADWDERDRVARRSLARVLVQDFGTRLKINGQVVATRTWAHWVLKRDPRILV